MTSITRRRFLDSSIKGAAALALLPMSGCQSDRPSGEDAVRPGEYPLVEVSGKTYREVGRRLGEAARGRIRAFLALSRDFPLCRDFARDRGSKLLEMLDVTRRYCPQLVEELEGMAEALDVPFLHLFAFNCRSEISVLSRAAGCSTILLRKGGRLILAHNEDGDDRNEGRMFVAKVTPPSGVRFISFVYPGLLPGNGPGFNDRGICQTTNYIEPKEVARGVPRYFVGRSVLEAKSLDEAVSLATCRERAFPWHHNLASFPEGRLISLETIPGRYNALAIEGVFVHTNHLIHPEMDQAPDVQYRSSKTRMRVISEAIGKKGEPATAGDMIALLSLHEGKPYSPCRHPLGDIHGATLGTALFEGPEAAMTLYHGNPCRAVARRYSF